MFYLSLALLPLYANRSEGFVQSVSLLEYSKLSDFYVGIYKSLFGAVIISGIAKILLTHFKIEKGQRILTLISMLLGTLSVLFLAMVREAYAISTAFILLAIKGILLLKCEKADSV